MYGTRPFGAVPPGEEKSRSFPTRRSSVPAGEVTVTASARVGGERVTVTLDVPYPARSCG